VVGYVGAVTGQIIGRHRYWAQVKRGGTCRRRYWAQVTLRRVRVRICRGTYWVKITCEGICTGNIVGM
jgi:hypothetical protein